MPTHVFYGKEHSFQTLAIQFLFYSPEIHAEYTVSLPLKLAVKTKGIQTSLPIPRTAILLFLLFCISNSSFRIMQVISNAELGLCSKSCHWEVNWYLNTVLVYTLCCCALKKHLKWIRSIHSKIFFQIRFCSLHFSFSLLFPHFP